MDEQKQDEVELTVEELEAQEAEEFRAAFDGSEADAYEPVEDEEEPEAAEAAPEDTEQPESESEEPDNGGGPLKSPEMDLEERMWARLQERYDSQLRNLAGHIGGINSKLSNLMDARNTAQESGVEKADEAPTDRQIGEAFKSGEKLEALREDFPEWAEAIEESMNSVLSRVKVPSSSGGEKSFEELRAELNSARQQIESFESTIPLYVRHPTWRQDVNEPGYRNWLAVQPPETQAKHFSDNVEDAIALLDQYKAFREQASEPNTPAENPGRQTNRRLESAVTPTDGRSVNRPGRKSEHEEFLEAFNSGR